MNAYTAYALTHKIDWLSQPVLLWINVALFVVASGFWIEAHFINLAFSPEIYGTFATALPSQAWAGTMAIAAVITFTGLVQPIHRRKVAIGACIHSAQFTALAYSAIMTGGELVIGLFASVVFAPMFLKLAYEAWENDSG
jgi:hypothetical protein